MPKIDIHADDYALTVNTSRDLLSCMEKGLLDSISILPNLSCFDECIELLYASIPSLPFLPKMSVHLNFVEGCCLAGADQAPLLAEAESGVMKLSWGGLFALSYFPRKRCAAKEQLMKEIKKQIEKGQAAVIHAMGIAQEHGIGCAQKNIRIDSHQHAHMIPIVWDALTEVIAEEEYKVEYIRNSKETIGAFTSEISLWKTYRPINFVKNRLLSLYSYKVDRYAKACHMEQMYLWGLIMSGHMDYDRIARLYPKVTAKADRDERTLEILMHPGRMLKEEITNEIDVRAAEDFYLKKDRHIEMNAAEQIRRKIG